VKEFEVAAENIAQKAVELMKQKTRHAECCTAMAAHLDE
jgi:hypothetical protein